MKRLLIIKPSSMGDVVHAFPAVRGLLAANPDLAVDWVIHPAFAELLDYLPGIRRKILFRRRELGCPGSFFPAFRELLRELRRERYDAVLDLQGLFRSALIGLLARKEILCGPAEARELPARLCYRRKLHCPGNLRHAVERNCALIQDFSGLKKIPTEYRLPVLEPYSAAAEKVLADTGLNTKPFIAIAPGARWRTKQWPPEFFARWAEKLAEKQPGMNFVLLGSPAEQSLCRIAAAATGMRTVNLCGRTSPGVLVEIIRQARMLICNDSGPMHLAAATGTPVAALFGPTDPDRTGPYTGNCRVIQPELDCIRCFHKQCGREKCHSAISPQQAADTAFELLKPREVRP